MQKIKIFLQGLIIAILYHILFFTIRIKGLKKIRQHLKKHKKPVVIAIFHQDFISAVNLVKHLSYIGLVSKSKDGQLFVPVFKLLGYKLVRGSRHRGGKEAMYTAIKTLNSRQAKGILIAVDGSKGPIYKVKPGAIKITLETGADIIPIGLKYSKFFMLKKSWDKTIIPKPFSKLEVLSGKTINIQNVKDFDLKLTQLEEELLKLKKIAGLT